MHEHHLVEALIRQVDRLARDQGGGVVTSVQVKLGALTGLSPQHLEETFAALTVGTPLAGTRLGVETDSSLDGPAAQQLLIQSIEVRD